MEAEDIEEFECIFISHQKKCVTVKINTKTMIRSRNNVEQYEWGNHCKGWHLLKSDSMSVIQEVMPPGSYEITHYHQKSQQLFFVLEGKATFIINGKILTLEPFESLHVLPGIKHRIINNTEQDLHFLVISEPKSHGDKIMVFE